MKTENHESRNFLDHLLQQKHENACKKLARAKRKVFDSGVQRATGSDITIDNVKNARKEREKLGGTFPRPKTSWREKHETFVSAVSASKQVNYALRTGTPLPPPPKASTPKDYVKCEYCGRSFNESSAQRHIPICKTQHEKKGPVKAAASTKPSNTSTIEKRSIANGSSFPKECTFNLETVTGGM
ncbi:unnamed protein product [Gongylonema pulchrum]|uniref:C2H2-type domain-containing protein n=1 Tax=Gongylonema pulchrum TaxID=637853 RepID=A0A183EBR9_9BILA|nr:unnamed protein product [Gongylonema pulchrum]